MKRIERLRLDINKEDSFNIVNFKQNDDCDLIVSLYSNNTAIDVSNQTVNFYVKKPDNTFVEQTTFISTEGNTVTINVDEQVVTKEGRAYGELTLRDESGKLTTSSFIINIGEQKVNINDLIESTDKVAILDEIREFIKQSKKDIEAYKQETTKIREQLTALDTSLKELQGLIEAMNANTAEITLQNQKALENIEAIKSSIGQASNTDTELKATIENSNTAKESINEKIALVESLKQELQGIISNGTIVKNDLASRIEIGSTLKTDLSGLNTEATSTYQELFALVEEAKRVIGLVREFIASNSLGDDVEQLKTDVGQLKTDVGNLKTQLEAINLGNYYTKEETDKLLENLNVNVDLSDYYSKGEINAKLDDKADKNISGIIGGSPLPDVFDGLDSVIDKEYLGRAKSIIAYNNNAKDVSQGVYFFAMFDYIPGADGREKVVTYKYSDGTFGSLSTNESGLKFRCYRKLSSGSWEIQSSLDSSHYIKNMEIYALNFPIYNRDSREEVLVYGKEIPKVFGDYNGVINNGLYAVKAIASNAPIDGLASGMLEVKTDGDFIYQEYNGDEDTYHRTRVNGNWNPWVMDGAGGSDIDLSAYATTEYVNNKFDGINIPDAYTKAETYNKEEVNKKIHLDIVNVESINEKIPNHGIVSSVESGYKNPLWAEIPTDTYKNVPANPNPAVYKWFMKCTHYNYHMVFYFDVDPTDKIAVIRGEKGEMFKWLDRTFTFDKYKGWYKSSTTGTSWSAFANDNHFSSTTRTINAMYGHNFNLMNGDNLEEVYYRGIAENAEEVQDSVTSFNSAVNKKHYKIRQEAGEMLDGSPVSGKLYGSMEVIKIDGDIKQTVTTESNDKFERILSSSGWSPWSKYNTEEIASEQIAILSEGESKDDIIDNEFTPEFLNYITPSIMEMNNGKLRIEYGEYLVDAVNNSQHVADPTREFTDVIMLKKDGFKQVLGCMAFIDKLDFHYSLYVQPNIVLVDPNNKKDCLRLYLAYLAPDAVKKDEPWHPINGIKKIKYCVFGY